MNVCVCVHNTVKKSQIIYVTVTLVTIIKKSFIYVIIWKRIVQYFIQDAAFTDSQIFFKFCNTCRTLFQILSNIYGIIKT